MNVIAFSIWERGTGNGEFLSRLAAHHPEINFFGVDDKPHMIKQAGKRQISNVSWSMGDANQLDSIPMIKKADGILMRYFILHLPNMKKVLADMAKLAKKGATLWIFDLDLDHFFCNPPHPSFDMIKSLLERFCERYSMDTRAGSLLPPLLEEAGFTLMEKEIEPFTNRELDQLLFQRFVSGEVTLYHRFLDGKPDSGDFREMNRFIREEMGSDRLVQYGMVMISARAGR